MPDKRPNFLVIVADDLGFSDLGCYGSEINTPNIDKIARQGVRFTDFHAAAACSPTRAMIMTGTDHHIAGLGNLIEWTNISGQNDPSGTGSTAPQRGMPGYEGYLNERVATLPEILRDAGYETLMAGKWHLGLTKERSAQKRGFERSLSHLPACSNHYLYEPHLVDQDETPTFLEASFIGLHMEDGEYVKKLPDGWYSSHGYGDKMVQFLQDRVDRKEERPFFAYLPFTAPHWPLQAPQEYIKKYHGVYDDGPDALRLKRLAKLQELALVPKDITPHPVVADEVKAWAEMSDDERAKSARAMEVFAAMVECIDANVGKVVDFLEKSGELENTFVCFMSDNGAEGAAYEAYPIVQGSVMQHLAKYYNNSLDNLGNYNSFIWYGPRWAQAATAPSRLFKAYTTEGGVRVPFTCKFPAGMKVDPKASGITHQFATVMDLAPTILDMAGVKHPAPTYQGRNQDSIHEKDFIQGWETCGRAACRQGDWKIVFIPKPKGPERWQLYNLVSDPGETDDLSSVHPDKLAHLIKLWDQYVLETGVIPLSPALGEYIAATELQMEENAWMEFDYWKPGAREAPEDPRFKRAPPRFKREVKAF
ncbi:Alkaline phosphatase-like, alpha/beta/alpha [Mycena venus]|uniref:Alkaline phosphatase-like, alpha/beta/alpha n=1 Tax=Mycena venus TaxID=2733690 RepID=A0A8H6YHP8_9AGAR|nr:Alkaline phosphatase-like, alpha/beta/alpha [Mycena venus]